MEIYRQNSVFNQELEEKVRALENKLRLVEEEKIELAEREKNLKRDLSMLSYNVGKNPDKNKIKDLELELAQERSKLETEKINVAEYKFLADKYSNENRMLLEEKNYIVRSYEEQLSKYRADDDLKKSQISMSEEKSILMSQEMNRLK